MSTEPTQGFLVLNPNTNYGSWEPIPAVSLAECERRVAKAREEGFGFTRTEMDAQAEKYHKSGYDAGLAGAVQAERQRAIAIVDEHMRRMVTGNQRLLARTRQLQHAIITALEADQ